MTAPKNQPNRKPWFSVASLWMLTVLAFYPVVPHDFLYYDDYDNVKENPRMNPPRWDRVGLYWKKPFIGMYVPVTYTTWTLVAQIARMPVPDPDGNDLNPYFFHFANLLLHMLTLLLIFLLLLDLSRHPVAAGLGALLFALHPAQVEPVAWVTGFRDLLGGFFSALALWQYLRYARGTPYGRREYVLATIAFALAMLSKTAAVTVPAIALVLDALILGRGWIRPIKSLWPWAIISLLGAAMMKFAQPGMATLTILPWPQRLRVAFDAIGFYVAKFLWPIPLIPDYARTPQAALAASPALAILGLALLVALAMCLWKRRRILAAALALFVVPLIPVIGLVPFNFQQHSTVADRYLYLSLLGPALLLAMLYARRPRNAVGIPIGCLLIVLAFLDNRQSRIWQDNETFLNYTAENSPDSWMAHNNLAALYLEAGDTNRASEQSDLAVKLKPDDPGVHTNLACVWIARGDQPRALAELREAARLGPRVVAAQCNLAKTLSEHGDFAEAEHYFTIARQLAPDDHRLQLYYAEHRRRWGLK